MLLCGDGLESAIEYTTDKGRTKEQGRKENDYTYMHPCMWTVGLLEKNDSGRVQRDPLYNPLTRHCIQFFFSIVFIFNPRSWILFPSIIDIPSFFLFLFSLFPFSSLLSFFLHPSPSSQLARTTSLCRPFRVNHKRDRISHVSVKPIPLYWLLDLFTLPLPCPRPHTHPPLFSTTYPYPSHQKIQSHYFPLFTNAHSFYNFTTQLQLKNKTLSTATQRNNYSNQ